MMLTASQKKLYDFICLRIERDGVCPSFYEMMNHMGLKSKSGVHRLISALEERGKITRLHNRARAIAPVYPQSNVSASARDTLLKIRVLAQRRVNRNLSHNAATQEILALCNGYLGNGG